MCAIKEYCKRNKYILERIYFDEAKSRTNDDREQFQAMISDSNRAY
ncbi:recombinase family protein [Tannockella kyphosi]|nr:recombinase family protein [Tannockella kyphosi]